MLKKCYNINISRKEGGERMFQKEILFIAKERKLYQLITICYKNKLLRNLFQWKRESLKSIKYINCSLMPLNTYGLNSLYSIDIKNLRQNMSYFQVEKSMNVWSSFKLKCFCLQSRPP